jgi:hypothetical protein
MQFADIPAYREHGFHVAVRPEFRRQPDQMAQLFAVAWPPFQLELTIDAGSDYPCHFLLVLRGAGAAGKFGWRLAERGSRTVGHVRRKSGVDVQTAKIAVVTRDRIGRMFDERTEFALALGQFQRLFLEVLIQLENAVVLSLQLRTSPIALGNVQNCADQPSLAAFHIVKHRLREFDFSVFLLCIARFEFITLNAAVRK